MGWKTGDILINKRKHSCEVKFIESMDESGMLLVDGIADEFYEPKEFIFALDKYKLLCKKEDRQDL